MRMRMAGINMDLSEYAGDPDDGAPLTGDAGSGVADWKRIR